MCLKHNGERDHHPVPEEFENILTIHPDWVAVLGEADDGSSENKKNSGPNEHLSSKHDMVG